MKTLLIKTICIIFSISIIFSTNLSAQVFDHVYSSDVTWDSDPVITGSIWIQQGVTLTINQGVTVSMPDYSFFFVDVNAKIEANGVTFEATDNYWLGITCRGTNSVYSVAPYEHRILPQPIIQISNSTISGMTLGIWSSSPVFNLYGETQYTTGGGRLAITNTEFSNNPINSTAIINFFRNRRVVNQSQINDLGFVSRCTFNDIDDFAAIYVHSSKNVRVIGSSFNGGSSYSVFQAGILCNDGSVMVDSYVVPNNTINCSFNDLRHGVYITDPQIGQHNSFIRQANFTNCLRGITVLSSPNLRILSNTISVPSLPTMNTHGIHIAGCTGFHIEDNTITGTSSNGDPINTWGIVIDNSGTNAHAVYRNTLIDCHYGLVGQGTNRFPYYSFGGLKFQCNDFTSFDDAYYMLSLKYDLTNPSHGVSIWQSGAIVDEPSSPCYNSMVDRMLPAGSENDFYNQNYPPNDMDILYFCPGGVNGPGIYDLKYKSPSVWKIETPLFTTETPHCESRLPCFGIHCTEYLPQSIEEMFSIYNTFRQSLANTINAGDHQYMLDLVENVTENNRYVVYYELLTKTPSIDILSIACANDIFYNFMIRDILVENSYGIKSESVRNALDQRQDPLTTQQRNQVDSMAQFLHEIEEWMIELSAMEQEYYFTMNSALNYYLDLDTTSTEDLLEYFIEMNDLYSQIRAIMIYLEEGELSEADERFGQLSSMEVLDEELQVFEEYYNIVRNIYEEFEGDFTQMGQEIEDELLTISEGTSYATHLAKSLLVSYFQFEYEPIYLLPGNSFRKSNEAKAIPSDPLMYFYPNPSKGTIFLNLNETDITLVIITDIKGKKLLVEQVNPSDNLLDISNLSKGLYLIHFYSNKNRVKTEKLIKK